MNPVREPSVAGRFYPSDPEECRRELEAMRRRPEIRGRILGGVVPHAGWRFSGPTAALSLCSIAPQKPETVVVFGAVHGHDRNRASIFPTGIWRTPLGGLRVDDELARRIANRSRDAEIDPVAHEREHSIEVELPLIQYYLGEDLRILPIMVRPGPWATELGQVAAAEALELGRRVVFVASTDLTHYGPAFEFEPAGRGKPGLRWAKEVNDRGFIRRVTELDADGVVPEAVLNRNACGAGAVSATIAAVCAAGATAYRELEHISSADVEWRIHEHPLNSVGYEAGIFVIPE